MVDNHNDNLGTEDEDPGSWLYANEKDVQTLIDGGTTERGSMLVVASEKGLSAGLFHEWKIPNMLYSPENIFSNKIALLDANYINPHKYVPVNDSAESAKEATSLAESISPTIASWYRAFRDIAIVGLLSVLVYIGIRILIGTVSEKAKYKERLTDWFVALCLVFFMHFIMAGIMMLSEKITDLFSNSINSGIIVKIDDGTVFRTSFMGYIRFAAQSNSWTEAAANGFMYLFLVGMTLRFTFIYLKRAMYLAFFTMIAPLVALTYPIDKAGDGKAQAFNMWIKEYFINAMLQPIHLILYSALVGAAITLVVQNPIYGIIALLFISTAEKWVKAMFKMDQAPLTKTSIGDVAVLGSMLNMGKNIVGGFGKAAGLVGIKFAMDRIGAGSGVADVAEGGTTVKDAMKTVGGKMLDGAADSMGRQAVQVGGKQTNAEDGTGTSLGSGVAEAIKEMKKMKLEKEYKNGQLTEAEFTRKMQKLLTVNKSEDNNGDRKEKTDEQRAKEIHTVNSGMVPEKAAIPANANAENLDDVSKKEDNSNSSKYYKKELQSKLIGKITEKDYNGELADMGIKAISGITGAVAGAPMGMFGAGLTGENKVIAAGAIGGANVGSAIADFAIKKGDTIFNNNVKVLVKDGGLKDENIIKNVAQRGKEKHWSEAKMLEIGMLAEAYPKLVEGDEESIEKVKNILNKKGVAKEKWDKAIDNIIDVQSPKDKNYKIQKKKKDKSTKKFQDWK